ncbi:MAG: DHH family phosphoesterase [Butyrivibrio sp.]|uniref:DHH family phosphoesterase n=1 Tax=Butyrivibrio sp. TaxID=28121 RepID=UPI0025C11471|nr:DHH family phosphoesterase [Butyrivibrio sp.]MBQ6587895.1 DHH family phosphoesterase [Butyrivibrio sp.]
MKLSALLKYNSIVIQCHDNPDADAICSGYVLYRYFSKLGKKVRFIYSGNFKITKSNLVYLIKELKIPIEFVSNLKTKPELLLLTDCQYGEGNVKKFPAKDIAVIDHHQVYGTLPKLNEVRSNLGSCCSVIWNLLKIEDEDFNIDENIATALYYGLYSDTNAFSEMSHPLDRDMIEALNYNKNLILKLKNMNLTLREAKIAGVAMLGVEYHPDNKYAILRTDPCDPNILGLIGDFIVAVDDIDVCLVYSILSFGVKFSIRSCSNETRADELATFLAQKIGSGGGHTEKAGGILKNELIIKQYPDYIEIDDDSAKHSISNIIRERMADYFENAEIIYANDTTLVLSHMSKYERSPITLAYVEPHEYVPTGNMAIIRTLAGDANIEIRDNTILILDSKGNVKAISVEKFNSSFKKTRRKFKFNSDYIPTIKNADTGKSFSLLPLAKSCESTGDIKIYAKKLTKTTKLFSFWDNDTYMIGQKGDYLAVSQDDIHDIFIIEKSIFKKIYKSV